MGQLSPHKQILPHKMFGSVPFHGTKAQNNHHSSLWDLPPVLEFSGKQQLFEFPLRASWTALVTTSVRNLYPENNVTPEKSYSPWQFLDSHSQPLSLKDTGCQLWISLAEEVMEPLLPQWLQHSF